MRFAPPTVTLPVELTWLLGAAFGPDLQPLAGDPDTVAALARQFDLGPRIIARHGGVDLEEHLGPPAGEMIRAHRRGVAIALAAERAAQRIARLAVAHDLPVIFLKGYALQLMESGPTGWRPFVDLDLLLSRRAAEELRRLLVTDGWATAGEAGNPQHLPPITAPAGTPVDIHFRLRGIRVAAARWATADELLAAGLCQPAGMGEGTWLPKPPLLAAHLAVHALEQHGYRPSTYPLLRVVADIADLVAAADGEALAAEAGRFVGETLAADEMRAVFTLSRFLAEGRTPTTERDEERGAATLLRHIVAGALDPAYRDSLAIDHTAGRLLQARQEGELMRYIARKLKGPGESPEAGSGPAAGLESVRRRLFYPIHLCARFATAAAARLRRAFD